MTEHYLVICANVSSFVQMCTIDVNAGFSLPDSCKMTGIGKHAEVLLNELYPLLISSIKLI